VNTLLLAAAGLSIVNITLSNYVSFAISLRILVSKLRMCGAVPPLHQYVFMAWYVVKHRDKFTLHLPLHHSEKDPCFEYRRNYSIAVVPGAMLLW
jgi:hypothetical protein